MRTNTTLRNFASAALFFLVLVASLWLTDCQRNPSLVIEMGTPPRFVVSGPGSLNSFVVSGPDLEREPHPNGDGERLMLSKTYWELAPGKTTSRSLDQIGPITYGKVPDGFVQIQPVNGAPTPLAEGHLYNVTFTVNDNHGINSFFVIREGKIVAEGER
jgi:hypothetical protein